MEMSIIAQLYRTNLVTCNCSHSIEGAGDSVIYLNKYCLIGISFLIHVSAETSDNLHKTMLERWFNRGATLETDGF